MQAIMHAPGPAPAEVPEEPAEIAEAQPADRKAVALSIDHLMNHRIKNPHCPVCQRSKMKAKPARAKKAKKPTGDEEVEAADPVFGRVISADHLITQDDMDQGIEGETAALTIVDIDTKWFDSYAVHNKEADFAAGSLIDFVGPGVVVQEFYTDNSPELKLAADKVGWKVHPTSTPGRPATNGVVERMNRKVIEGGCSILEQCGLPHEWWSKAIRHFCWASNIEVVDGESSYNRRFKKGHFKGPKYPFGCLIDFKPSPVDETRRPKFGTKAIPGLFLGYHLLPGGRWKGDYIVAALEDFKDGGPARPRLHRVKEVYANRAVGFDFPLKAIHDLRKRTVLSESDLRP